MRYVKLHENKQGKSEPIQKRRGYGNKEKNGKALS
jgi:hypothetical protein